MELAKLGMLLANVQFFQMPCLTSTAVNQLSVNNEIISKIHVIKAKTNAFVYLYTFDEQK
jgi:hypothetical protein